MVTCSFVIFKRKNTEYMPERHKSRPLRTAYRTIFRQGAAFSSPDLCRARNKFLKKSALHFPPLSNRLQTKWNNNDWICLNYTVYFLSVINTVNNRTRSEWTWTILTISKCLTILNDLTFKVICKHVKVHID